jgi:hypothetical protein
MESHTSRWIWILIALSAWVVVFVTPWQSLPLMQCPIKATLGIPCPTCGGTTAVMALKRLDIAEAFRSNPLVTTGLLAGGFWGLLMILVPTIPTPDRVGRVLRYVIISSTAITMIYLIANSFG